MFRWKMTIGVLTPCYSLGLMVFLCTDTFCDARNVHSWLEAPPDHPDLLDDQNTTMVWKFQRPTEPVDAQILLSYHIPGKNYDDIIVDKTVNTTSTSPVQMDIIYVNYKEKVEVSYTNGTISMLFREPRVSDGGELLMDVRTSAWIFHDTTSFQVYSAPRWTDNSSNTVTLIEGTSSSLLFDCNSQDTPAFTNLTVVFTPPTSNNVKKENASSKIVLYVKPLNNSVIHHVYTEASLFDKLHVTGNPSFSKIMFYFFEMTEAYTGRYDIILMTNVSGVMLSRTVDIVMKESQVTTKQDLDQSSCSCSDAHSLTTPAGTQSEIQRCHQDNKRQHVTIIALYATIAAILVLYVVFVVFKIRLSKNNKARCSDPHEATEPPRSHGSQELHKMLQSRGHIF